MKQKNNMLKKLLFSLFLLTCTIQGQTYVKGTINVSNDIGNWAILYQLEGVKQVYIKNDTIANGVFKIDFPENASKGMYRIFYDMKNEKFVDFIYNNESVELFFDATNPYESLQFSISEENKAYRKYILETNATKQKLDSLQVVYFKTEDEKQKEIIDIQYATTRKNYDRIQSQHERISSDKLANHFIKASRKYYAPSIIRTAQEFLNSEKQHYFDFIDFNDNALIFSTFLSEKVMDYIFYLNISEDIEVQNALYKRAANEVMQKIGNNAYIKSELLTLMLVTFAQAENITLTDYLVDEFYKKLPDEYQNKETLGKIQSSLRLAVGRKAPEITWNENGNMKKLSEFNGSDRYILVFWSTSCPHCLKEIPMLYEYTKDNSGIHVVAIALEDNEKEFNKYALDLANWTHILGLEKWENSIALEYKITSTPTYFVLDATKKIISKPEFLEDVKLFLENE
jgi:thiol-disulfide isomerase/thioredoxin